MRGPTAIPSAFRAVGRGPAARDCVAGTALFGNPRENGWEREETDLRGSTPAPIRESLGLSHRGDVAVASAREIPEETGLSSFSLKQLRACRFRKEGTAPFRCLPKLGPCDCVRVTRTAEAQGREAGHAKTGRLYGQTSGFRRVTVWRLRAEPRGTFRQQLWLAAHFAVRGESFWEPKEGRRENLANRKGRLLVDLVSKGGSQTSCRAGTAFVP